MFIVAAVVVALGFFVLRLPDPIVMMAAGATLVVVDLAMRLAKMKESGWLMSNKFGGYLYFAPVWIFGVIVVVINVVNFFITRR